MKKLIVLILSVLCMCSYSHAEILRVPGNSSTIQGAINLSSYGDVILIEDGYYPEKLTLKAGITLIGSSPDTVIIDGTNVIKPPINPNDCAIMKLKNKCYVKNLRIVYFRPVPSTNIVNAIECKNANNVLIENVYIEGNAAISINGSSNIMMKKVEVYYDASHFAGEIYNSDRVTIERSIFFNGGSGLTLSCKDLTGISLISSNFITGHTVMGASVVNLVNCTKVNLLNSILFSYNGPCLYSKNSYGSVEFCLWYDAPISNDGLLSIDYPTMLCADPLFSDMGARDYRLKKGSPAIYAGDPILRDENGSRSSIGAR